MKTTEKMIETAKEEYKTACQETKEKLIKIFGEECFSENIMERVKTFEGACRVLGIDSSPIINQSKEEHIISYEKLSIIARALNQGWTPNWSDKSEQKWYPWFTAAGSSGFGFSHSGYDYWRTHADAGSRLCFKSEELATYAGKQFENIYKKFMM